MKVLRSVLSAVAFLFVATAVPAQQTNVRATVPFDFVVGDRAYPAGDYSLKSFSVDSAVIRIQSPESTSILIPSNSCQSGKPSKITKIVFRRMGDEYFLYQVWVAGNSSGREFPQSRREMRLAKNEKPEQVIVAANIYH